MDFNVKLLSQWSLNEFVLLLGLQKQVDVQNWKQTTPDTLKQYPMSPANLITILVTGVLHIPSTHSTLCNQCTLSTLHFICPAALHFFACDLRTLCNGAVIKE